MVGPPLEDPDNGIRTGVGGEVEVLAGHPTQGVANGPSHQVELVSGLFEARSKLLGCGREIEELGDGGVSHRGKDTLGS
jgi:hypothetical protein